MGAKEIHLNGCWYVGGGGGECVGGYKSKRMRQAIGVLHLSM